MRRDDSKPYDLEEHTLEFAKARRAFVKKVPRTIANIEDAKQFIRSSGSIGANYIAANESIGKKDFLMKVKTCRREAKESSYWLRLLNCDSELDSARAKLLGEAQRINEYLRRNCQKTRGAHLELSFRICFEVRISNFGFKDVV